MSAIAQLHLRAEEPADRPQTQTEQQLREAHKMEAIGRLVGGVAHDFNNLLTGMVLGSELILAGLEENHRLRRFAEEGLTPLLGRRSWEKLALSTGLWHAG